MRTKTDIQRDLDAWYAARTAAAEGRSVTIVTSAGTRSLTTHSMREIESTIGRLERELSAASAAPRQGPYDFALANMGDNGANR